MESSPGFTGSGAGNVLHHLPQLMGGPKKKKKSKPVELKIPTSFQFSELCQHCCLTRSLAIEAIKPEAAEVETQPTSAASPQTAAARPAAAHGSGSCWEGQDPSGISNTGVWTSVHEGPVWKGTGRGRRMDFVLHRRRVKRGNIKTITSL